MDKRILTLDTERRVEVRPITPLLRECITDSGIENGTLFASSVHTTLGLVVQETSKPNLYEDFVEILGKLVEDNGHLYRHRCALHPSGACREDRFNGPGDVRQPG